MPGLTLLTELSRHPRLAEALPSGTVAIPVNRTARIALAQTAAATRELRVTVIARGAPTGRNGTLNITGYSSSHQMLHLLIAWGFY